MASIEHELLAYTLTDMESLAILIQRSIGPELFIQEATQPYNRLRALFVIVQLHYISYRALLSRAQLEQYLDSSDIKSEERSAVMVAYGEVIMTAKQSSVDYLLDQLRRQFQKEKLRKSLQNQARLFNENRLDELLKIGITDYCDITSIVADTVIESNPLETAGDRRVRYTAGLQKGVFTGFSTIDKATNGLQPGRLHYIVSGTSEGKSTMLANIAFNAWKTFHHNVLLISAEDYAEDVQMKLDSIATNIPTRSFMHRDLKEWELQRFDSELQEQEKLRDACRLNIIGMQESCTPSFIESKIMEPTKLKYDLVVVDYLQELELENAGKHDKDHVYYGEITSKLRRIAKKYRIPLLTASQISRSGWKDNRKDKKTYYDTYSDSLSQLTANKSDFRLSLRALDPEQAFDCSLVDLEGRITKNRQGPKPKFGVRANFETGKMIECKLPELAEKLEVESEKNFTQGTENDTPELSL